MPGQVPRLDEIGAGQAIREVARACGSAELSPFYWAFRRWCGLTPQVYRRRLLLAASVSA